MEASVLARVACVVLVLRLTVAGEILYRRERRTKSLWS